MSITTVYNTHKMMFAQRFALDFKVRDKKTITPGIAINIATTNNTT